MKGQSCLRTRTCDCCDELWLRSERVTTRVTIVTNKDLRESTVMQNALEGHPQGPVTSRSTVRRKSSAALLSSFKAPSGSQQPVNLAIQLPPTPSMSSTPIPGPPMGMGRDWDSQSIYSESAGSSVTTNTASGTPLVFQGTSVEYVRDLVQKRIVTLTYMRNTHEGYVASPSALIHAYP